MKSVEPYRQRSAGRLWGNGAPGFPDYLREIAMSLAIPAHRTGASQILNNSAALPCPVALATGGRAGAGLGQLAVGTDACLGMDAPEQAVVGGRHGGVVVHADELLL